MSKSKTIPNLDRVAQQRFGYTQLRPEQKNAIQAVLEGHDTLVIMPTGSGKSAIYQIAALLIPGATVVVSPLIALQRDQVKAIEEQDIGDAAAVNSSVKESERQEAFEQLEDGDLEFVFLAPEQFNQTETLDHLQSAKPSLFVIDEAHCISSWGHDFRPDYLRLGQVIEALGHPRVLALTATAAPPVRAEIVERLGMQAATVLVQGFDRPNIQLNVERFDDEQEKQKSLIRQAVQIEKPGIVYAATRRETEELAEQLEQEGIRSRFYHAGMKTKERQAVEVAFMADEVDVLVATTAFGMGIDKPNVRFVFHANIPDSLDSYYQQIGRAGRDGAAAHAILFYNPEDLNLRRFLASGGQINESDVEQVLQTIQQQEVPIEIKVLQEQTDLSKSKVKNTVNYLVDTGNIEILPTGEISPATPIDSAEDAVEAVAAEQERRHQFERSRLEMMRNYAEVRHCRREYLLNYFGEKYEAPCDNCDNCKSGSFAETSSSTSKSHQPFPLDSKVIHKSWGEGIVMRYEGDKIVILFDQVGYKTLDIKTALLRQLLTRADKAAK